VRINPAGTPWHPDDLQAAARWSDLGIAGLVVPKAESADGLLAIVAACGRHMRLLPLVESVAGLEAVDALARSPQVLRLAFGHLDFQVDAGMDCSADESELTSLRLRIVLASRRAGLPPPLDGVTTDIGDAARLAADAERARRLGFGGKLCIHPAQVAGVQSAFKPTPEQLAWAQRVLDAAATQGGAFSLDGKMVDGPVIAKAKRIASSAG
jgi:citrate lyase subunit beta/citryl-CoA lyase